MTFTLTHLHISMSPARDGKPEHLCGDMEFRLPNGANLSMQLTDEVLGRIMVGMAEELMGAFAACVEQIKPTPLSVLSEQQH